MQHFRKHKKGSVHLEGSIQLEQRSHFQDLHFFDDALCHTIRSTLELIVTCPVHVPTKE